MKRIVLYMILIMTMMILTACGSMDAEDKELPTREGDSSIVNNREMEGNTLDAVITDSENGEDETVTFALDFETEDIKNGAHNREGDTMKITVGDVSFTATLTENSSVEAWKELLAKEPLTICMSDYANMEKVGPLGVSLPRNDEQITTEAGDIILYQGNSLVIYYDTNTWNFTRIGKINEVTQEELLEVLGEGDVTVTFSLD